MARACYDPNYAVQAHTNMEKAVGKQSSLLKYFSTHPDFQSRIEALRSQIPTAERERAKFCKTEINAYPEHNKTQITHWYDGMKIWKIYI